MEDLKALLHQLAEAIHRPADHPLEDLSAAVDALEGAPGPVPASAPDPAPSPEPSEPDTPAPVFQPAPAPFGSESEPEAPPSA